MSYSGTNQWGPYVSNNGTDAEFPNYVVPLGTATPQPTGSIVVPQSPSGSVTNESASSNYVSGETSTETYLSTFGETEPQQGTMQINAPCSFNTLNPATFQTFRWE